MNGDNGVIIFEGGVVQTVYSDNSNIEAVIIDIDNKKIGEEYIHTFEWPETQFDDEEIKDLMGQQYGDRPQRPAKVRLAEYLEFGLFLPHLLLSRHSLFQRG